MKTRRLTVTLDPKMSALFDMIETQIRKLNGVLSVESKEADVKITSAKKAKQEDNLELFEKVKMIITEKLNVSSERVILDAEFTDDLGADSLDQVELIMAFEDNFEIEIPDEETEKIRTVREAVAYLATKL